MGGQDLNLAGNRPLDMLKPSEVMMTEICIFNKPLNATEIKNLSGFKTAPTKKVETNANQFIPRNAKKGSFSGPMNPYLAVRKSLHDNIIAWYRPGNDSGWTSKTTHSTNGLPVFNHAKPRRSGRIIVPNSGTLNHYSSADAQTIPLNFLSGNFYGFTSWTGSVANDLSYSDSLRQRWNGIADLSNPAQYTLMYHRPDTRIVKTWFNVNETTEMYGPTFLTPTGNPYVERPGHNSEIHSKHLSGTPWALCFLEKTIGFP